MDSKQGKDPNFFCLIHIIQSNHYLFVGHRRGIDQEFRSRNSDHRRSNIDVP